MTVRPLTFLAALAAVALAACDKKPAASDSRTADQALAADNLATNDLTAIDAASGSAANMAEDVDFTDELVNADDDRAGNNSAAPRKSRPAATASPARPAASNDSAAPDIEDGAD